MEKVLNVEKSNISQREIVQNFKVGIQYQYNGEETSEKIDKKKEKF